MTSGSESAVAEIRVEEAEPDEDHQVDVLEGGEASRVGDRNDRFSSGVGKAERRRSCRIAALDMHEQFRFVITREDAEQNEENCADCGVDQNNLASEAEIVLAESCCGEFVEEALHFFRQRVLNGLVFFLS
jgi:hypothetical protein